MIDILAAEVAAEEGILDGRTRFVDHKLARAHEGFDEQFWLVAFDEARNPLTGSLQARNKSIGGVLRPSFGAPRSAYIDRHRLTDLIKEDIGGDAHPAVEGVYRTGEPPPLRRAAAHNMDLSLEWEPPAGDIILKRVTDFERGFDLGNHLQTTLTTNVAYSVAHHSPSGFEYGYNGSGPADLALNILNMFVAPGSDGQPLVECFAGVASRTAWELHQRFKAQFIAAMPWEGGIINGHEIRSWIEASTPESGSD